MAGVADFTANKGKLTSAFVTEFGTAWEVACQQRQSRLEKAVVGRPGIVGAAFTANDIGMVEVNERKDRFQDTVWQLPDAGARYAAMHDYDVFVPVEFSDRFKLLAQPNGQYMQAMLAAMERKKDAIIFAGLTGTVQRKDSYTGALAAVDLPTTQKITNGSGVTGSALEMTIEKLIAARAIFRANEADEMNGESLYIAYNAEMLAMLLAQDKVTSSDYASIKALQAGKLDGTWLGFNWIPYEFAPTTPASGSGSSATPAVYNTAVWAGTALHFGTGSNFASDVVTRGDKSNAIQLSGFASYGCTRVNEKKVVQIEFRARN